LREYAIAGSVAPGGYGKNFAMRLSTSTGLACLLGAAAISFTATVAEAQRYRVVCVAPGNPACRTSCGSNTHAVMCYAQMQNGRCVRYCGRPR
jgi:hypothetical protein